MGPRRHPLARPLVVWTAVLALLAVALAVWCMASLDAAQQRCYLEYPAVPCPGNDDPAVTGLTIAFFGLPGLWLAGVAAAIALRVRHQKHAT
jgi:hypothetical protein